MKKVHVLSIAIVVMFLLPGGNVEARAAGCDAIGNVRFICDQLGPEDLAPVPGSEWVLASGMAANGAIRGRAATRGNRESIHAVAVSNQRLQLIEM